jgi:hypothetical protein
MPNDSQNLSTQTLVENQTLADILLASSQITKDQHEDIKVKSASKGVSKQKPNFLIFLLSL